MSGFSTCKMILSPLSYCTLRKERAMSSKHLRGGELHSTSHRVEYLHELFGIFFFLYEDVSSFPQFVYFNHSLLSMSTHRYLFYSLCYKLILIYLLFQIIPALTIANSFSWLPCPFVMPLSLCLSWAALYFLILHDTLDSFISCPSPRISCFFKQIWFLLLEISVVNQDLGIRYFIASQVSLFSGPLNWQRKEIYLCILTSVYMDVYKYLYYR